MKPYIGFYLAPEENVLNPRPSHGPEEFQFFTFHFTHEFSFEIPNPKKFHSKIFHPEAEEFQG
jgi:hypothetical protein